MENPLLQFLLELVRALLVDELSGRVRKRVGRLLGRRIPRGLRGVLLHVHKQNRDRLLHKVYTEAAEEP
jgi:hypothetical protein